MIVLSNDDGFTAEGLRALRREMMKIAEVVIVAPETEQSAMGHAITLNQPLKVRKVVENGEFIGYAVNGTPADCVKIAIAVLLEEPPEMVVSGVNLGGNLGTCAIYSGTVSAATEAAIMGIPAIAVSLNTFENPDFGFAAEFARKLVPLVLEKENAVDEFRTLIGATNPADAAPGTIRREFATSLGENAIHGSDSDENAEKEVAFYFAAGDILSIL
ncbi:MAG: 5'/3'-nucleotidase SurE [Candidatus Marinimicrobia bacterium]|nr:5'/3'-nucleotidase SurE [Candidatus Neomarinimicrobiota bacterium]